MDKTATLLKSIDYKFNDVALLVQALTHRSHSNKHNERLEFLGDSILNFVVASLLYNKFTMLDEGSLSRLRANLVNQSALAEIANKLDLAYYLRLGEGELKSGGFRRPSILSDTLEAIFGAVFLDGGYDCAKDVITKLYKDKIDTIDPKSQGKDSKTLLQELLQSRKLNLPVYTVISTQGAAHDQLFNIQCNVVDLGVITTAKGSSRRSAEQAAAQLAIENIQTVLTQKSKRNK